MSDPTAPAAQPAATQPVGPAKQPPGVAVELPPARIAPAPTRPSQSDARKRVGAILSILIVFGAIVLSFYVWSIIEQHPRTDDATVRANVVGIVPRVRGQIVKLNVQDNQAVHEGDLLFEIDPDDYELSLEKAKAALVALDKEIEVARAQDAELKFAVKAAEAAVDRAHAQLKQTDDTLHRLQPLLPKGFATAEQVDQAGCALKVMLLE